jgi:hypothetical protein
MKVDREIAVMKFVVGFVVVALVLWAGIAGVKKFRDWNAEINERDRIAEVKNTAYRARLPKAGERVVLNDANVSVIKEYFWSRKFRIRYDNGSMADVHEKEMLDLKKVKHKIPEKQKNV